MLPPMDGTRPGWMRSTPALYHMQDKELIPSARSLGLALHVWTVDDEEYMEALVRQGVEAIITNKPDVCRNVADQLNPFG